MLIVLSLLPLYWLPSIIAYWRGNKRFWDIFFWNLAFGLAIVPWFMMLGVAWDG